MERRYIPVALTPETHNRLKELGKMGDTYEEIVKRLLDEKQDPIN